MNSQLRSYFPVRRQNLRNRNRNELVKKLRIKRQGACCSGRSETKDGVSELSEPASNPEFPSIRGNPRIRSSLEVLERIDTENTSKRDALYEVDLVKSPPGTRGSVPGLV